MKKDTIFQFVGFETALALENFSVQWGNFARRVFKDDVHAITLQQQVATRNRYKFVSRNEWPKDNFKFVFMGSRMSEHFPDHEVKVIQTGGYSALQWECDDSANMEEIKVLAFLLDEKADLDMIRALPCRNLNIYQAYYESCVYAYVLEFYVTEEEVAKGLVTALKKLYPHLETGIYKESLILQG